MRTMIAPGKWRDDGPAPGRVSVGHWFVQAATGDAMVPVLKSAAVKEKERAWHKDRNERRRLARAAVVKPVCGALLPLAQTLCARRPGHKDSHRSREVMDADTKMRRTNWRVVGGVE